MIETGKKYIDNNVYNSHGISVHDDCKLFVSCSPITSQMAFFSPRLMIIVIYLHTYGQVISTLMAKSTSNLYQQMNTARVEVLAQYKYMYFVCSCAALFY